MSWFSRSYSLGTETFTINVRKEKSQLNLSREGCRITLSDDLLRLIYLHTFEYLSLEQMLLVCQGLLLILSQKNVCEYCI